MVRSINLLIEAAPTQQVKLGPTVDNNASTATIKESRPIWLALCGVVRDDTSLLMQSVYMRAYTPISGTTNQDGTVDVAQ